MALTNKFGTDLSGLARSSGVEEVKLQLRDKNLVLVGSKEEIEKVMEQCTPKPDRISPR